MNLNFYMHTKNELLSLKKSLVFSLLVILSVSYSYAQPATALHFDGVNDVVNVAVKPSLNISSAITLEAWIKPSKITGVQDVLCKSSASSNSGYIFPRTSNGWESIEFLLKMNGSNWKSLKVPFGADKANQWHHLAATYDGYKMKIYIDGIKVASEFSYVGTIITNNNPLTIGGQPGFLNEYYKGDLDEARIWNRALTQCEIQNNMNCELGASQNGLAAYYKFNQGLINLPNLDNTLLDASGNDANGTLKNFNLFGTTSNWSAGTVSNTTCAVFTPAVVTIGSEKSLVPVGGTIKLTATGGESYSWTGPNGFTSTQQNPTITGVELEASGVYTVTATTNSCAVTANTIIVVALRASGLSLDGVNDNINIPYNPSFNSNTLSIESWIYPTEGALQIQNVLSKSSSFEDDGFIFPKTDDGWESFNFTLSIDNQIKILSAPMPMPADRLNKWHHLAATYDGYFMRIYRDGVLVGSLEVSGNITTNTNDITVGNKQGRTQYFKGKLDELRVWSRALSQCEIINNMQTCELNGDNDGLAQQLGLTAYYRFNQGLINLNNADYNTLADSSGKGNHGTLNNFTLNASASNWIAGKVDGLCAYFPPPLLAASANGSAFEVGSNANLVAVGGNGTYAWDGPNSFSSLDQNLTFSNVQPSSAGTYTVTAQYVNCVVTASTRFSVSTMPQITAAGPATFCPSNSVTLSAANSGTDYKWYRNDVLINGAASNQFTATLAGNYTVTVTDGNKAFVSAPVTVTILVDNTPPVPNVVSLPTLHLTSPVTVTTIPTAVDNCRGLINGVSNIPLTFTERGNYTITWTYDDQNGNVSTQSQEVVVVRPPDNIPPVLTVPSDITENGNVSICGAIVNFTATATDNSGDPITINFSHLSGSIFQSGNTTVTITATDVSNNVTTRSFTITVLPTIVAAITGNTTICTGATTQLATISSATGGTWSSSNNTIATVNAGLVTGRVAGTATIIFTDNCGAMATALVTVNGIPSAPVVSVSDNCGTSTLSTNAGGTLLWNTNASGSSINVSVGGTYSVTQTVNGCTSAAGFGSALPTSLPATPVVTVTNNCAGSTLSTDAGGSLLWSTGATGSAINVTAADTYSVTQTVNGCTSAAGSGTAAPIAIPSAPEVSVTNNCGTSILFINTTGTLLWNTGAVTPSITVPGGTYSVTRTVGGCTSAAGTGIASPISIPSTPVVTVVNNCGTSTLSTNAAGTLLWNTNASGSSINVSVAGTYSVTQSVNGCTSAAGFGSALPISLPATPVVTVTNTCAGSTLSIDAAGASLLWNTNATTSSINVSEGGVYSVTRTIDGCTSLAGTGTALVKTIPSIPVITVVNNCGSSTLSTNAAGTLLWSNSATGSSINVSNSGNYSVTVTNTDGCSAVSAVVSVTVKSIPPVSAITGNTTITVSATSQLANSAPGGIWTSNNSIASVSSSGLVTGMAVGSATISYAVTTGAGCTTAVTTTVTVNPNCVLPSLTGIADISANITSGICGTPVTYVFTMSGTPAPALTYTFSGATSGSGTGSGSGSVFSKGRTNVVIAAANSCGITTTSFVVTVIDLIAPSINCPSNISINCGSSIDPSVTGSATGTDNCGGVVITYSDAVSGSIISRTWTAIDASGNIKTCVQTITQISPSISISSVPSNNTFTGGIATNLYLGYGAQSTNLQVVAPASGAPYTYVWTGSHTALLTSTTTGSPLFTPLTGGSYMFTVAATNRFGCTKTTLITICVTDIRVVGKNGSKDDKKVYLCHVPSGDLTKKNTLSISINAVASHLANHPEDRLGSCDQLPCGISAALASTPVTTTQTATQESAIRVAPATSAEELKVMVMPNPTTTYFTLKLESKYETPVSLRVSDANGRVIDAKSKIGSNSNFQIGHNYNSGIYYAEIIQGTKRQVVRLIKIKG